ncbi:hypothetical protein ACP8HI_01405 [Paenibacillus sp. FA6]
MSYSLAQRVIPLLSNPLNYYALATTLFINFNMDSYFSIYNQ